MSEENTEMGWGDEVTSDPRYQGLPDALIKACFDTFDYALALRNGYVIRFEAASVSSDGKWVHLQMDYTLHAMTGIDYSFDRGIDVRIEDILWVADAPEGS